MSEYIKSSFREPSALDYLGEFNRRYRSVVERRISELRVQIDARQGENPSPELHAIFEEYDSLRYLDADLHAMIRAFILEAVKPLQDTLVSIAMRTPGPFVMPVP